tara:strand:- start:369 stop:656 length:288 start_codon:yes stop_codon:yes gene_type:complete
MYPPDRPDNGWTTQEQTAELKVGDIVAINGNLVDCDKEVMRFIITDANIGNLQVMVLSKRRDPQNLTTFDGLRKQRGDFWAFRRAKLIGKNWIKQ